MFGFKKIKKDDVIIKKKALEDLHKKIKNLGDTCKAWIVFCERNKEDADSLRKQNSELRLANDRLNDRNLDLEHFKRDTLETLGNLDFGSFCLQLCASKCYTCDKEHSACEKYTFGKFTFCKIPKEQKS